MIYCICWSITYPLLYTQCISNQFQAHLFEPLVLLIRLTVLVMTMKAYETCILNAIYMRLTSMILPLVNSTWCWDIVNIYMQSISNIPSFSMVCLEFIIYLQKKLHIDCKLDAQLVHHHVFPAHHVH